MSSYTLISLLKKSVVQYMATLYSNDGYIIGRNEDELSIVNDWRGFDFTLPTIAIEYIDDDGYKETDLGTELTRGLVFELNVFARKTLERENLADLFISSTTTEGIPVYDYNEATPSIIGYARAHGQGSVPNTVLTPGGEQRNMVTIVFSLDYREKIN